MNRAADEYRRQGEAFSHRAADPVFADLRSAPYRLLRPSEQHVPFIFASPHSGSLYPTAFLSQSRLNGASLRRSEDAFVDRLFSGVLEIGAPLIAARFPRAYVDANRAANELDSTMFAGTLPLPADSGSPRVNAGLGVIPRLVRDGAEIYRSKLDVREAEERLLRLHKPYHDALQQLVRETQARFCAAVVVDCHSMPSAASPVDVVLGDRYGTAASHALMRAAEAAFQRNGFIVARNVPYAGGYTTQRFGQPRTGIHALQIEINRALYLDEERIALTEQFPELAARLRAALRELSSIDRALLLAQTPSSLAAE